MDFLARRLARNARNVTIDRLRKSSTIAALLAPGSLLAANVSAQQTPAATTQNPSATTSKPPASKSTTPAKTTSAPPAALKTRKERFSYALGMNFGNGWRERLKSQSVDYDPALMLEGF